MNFFLAVKLRNIFLLAVALAMFDGCRKTGQLDAPEEIRARALEFAGLYAQSETEYEMGGQDPLRVVRIDCSGLVVMCYKYALVDTGYGLPFEDASAAAMYDLYSRNTDSPVAGDLIFMGAPESADITHITLFQEKKDGIIYFIDSTKKPAEGDYPEVNGVSERHYPEGDPHFKSFGVMQVVRAELE